MIAGKIDEASTLAAIVGGYGAHPAFEEAPPGRDRSPSARRQSEVARHDLRPVPADRLVIGFPAPPLGAPDRAAYEVLNELLAGGPSSRLNRALVVDKRWASSVHGDVAPTRDPGLYAIWIQLMKGHTAEEAERVVVEAARRPGGASGRRGGAGQGGGADGEPRSGSSWRPATGAPRRWGAFEIAARRLPAVSWPAAPSTRA